MHLQVCWIVSRESDGLGPLRSGRGRGRSASDAKVRRASSNHREREARERDPRAWEQRAGADRQRACASVGDGDRARAGASLGRVDGNRRADDRVGGVLGPAANHRVRSPLKESAGANESCCGVGHGARSDCERGSAEKEHKARGRREREARLVERPTVARR